MNLTLLLALGTTITVSPAGPVRTLTEALAAARPGDRIVIRAGRYREPAIVVGLTVTIIGEGRPMFQGGAYSTIEVRADGVEIRGLAFEQVTPSATEDRAAILLQGIRDCRIVDNEIRGAYFGIYAMRSVGCTIAGNRLRGAPGRASTMGNGIHLWQSGEMTVRDNTVEGHRDGIYLEFTRAARVSDNLVRANSRYGLHFMRSDSCAYDDNRFERNGAGVAVMYSRGVRMTGNRFERNRGGAAYGLLLKEISDATVRGNSFIDNTVGLYLEDSNRNLVEGNLFRRNGWAVKVLANAAGNRFTGNRFEGNSFDAATNSRSASSSFDRNWWDRYRGYDLDRDGLGDVPYRPVRLFSLVAEQHRPALILLRSAFVDLLDGAERLMPMLTPDALADRNPLMRRPR
jgi:nitrous oxidase accessory protein